MSLSRSGLASAAHSTANMNNSAGASGGMGILASNGEKIQGYKYSQGTDG